MSEDQNAAAVQQVCRGHADAVRFLEDVTDVLHLWDDLVDKDKPVQDLQINSAMWKALVDLPRNPFYAMHFQQLNTLLMAAIINWETATEMEREPVDDNDLAISFILRSSYIDLVLGVALIVGGKDHATRMMLPARRLWHNEGFAGYRQALVQEQIERGKANGM